MHKVFEKSKVYEFEQRKIDKTKCDIKNDNHIIGLMQIWRSVNHIIGNSFAHRGVLLVTGNYYIDISKTPHQQREEFQNFNNQPDDQQKLRYFVLEFLHDNESCIREIIFNGDIYLGQQNQFHDRDLIWYQEEKVIDIYSYISTVQQAYHLFSSNAGQYNKITNNCNHAAISFIQNVQKYEEYMRNPKQFDMVKKMDEIINNEGCTVIDKYIQDCQHLIFFAIESKKFGFWNSPILKVWIILKDYKPFPLNYGQRVLLEKQYEQIRVQRIYQFNDQVQIKQQWQEIKSGKKVQKQLTDKHPLEYELLANLKEIEY